jgi:hypothetical protein
MPIPVPIASGPYPITDPQNATAEALLEAFAQLVEYGTSGATLTTPPLTVPDGPNPVIDPITLKPKVVPVVLDTASKQLFYRHFALAIAAVITSGGGGGDMPGSSVYSGKVTVGTSPGPLPSVPANWTTLRNTGNTNIFISASGTDDFLLESGASESVRISNLSLIQAISDAPGGELSYFGTV